MSNSALRQTLQGLWPVDAFFRNLLAPRARPAAKPAGDQRRPNEELENVLEGLPPYPTVLLVLLKDGDRISERQCAGDIELARLTALDELEHGDADQVELIDHRSNLRFIHRKPGFGQSVLNGGN